MNMTPTPSHPAPRTTHLELRARHRNHWFQYASQRLIYDQLVLPVNVLHVEACGDHHVSG